MKDRLIELLINTPPARLKCVGRAVGKTYTTASGIANHLLANGVIVLPCNIGDMVYIIDEGDGECAEDYVLGVKVLQFFISENGVALDLKLPLGMRLNTWAVIGKNVFLTKEEAEKALAERSNRAAEKNEGKPKKKPDAIYLGFSHHDCESHYKCPLCGKSFGGWSINIKDVRCPNCKEELGGIR